MEIFESSESRLDTLLPTGRKRASVPGELRADMVEKSSTQEIYANRSEMHDTFNLDFVKLF